MEITLHSHHWSDSWSQSRVGYTQDLSQGTDDAAHKHENGASLNVLMRQRCHPEQDALTTDGGRHGRLHGWSHSTDRQTRLPTAHVGIIQGRLSMN